MRHALRGALGFALLAGLATFGVRPLTAEVEVPELYVGFEDQAEHDYDYNDFGMTMSAGETYGPDGQLARVTMSFEAVCRLGGDEHEVHILRPFAEGTRWSAQVRRSRASVGAETPEGRLDGQGDLDVLLFDSARTAPRDVVVLTVEILESAEPRVPLGSAPLAAQGSYEPWLLNRSTGQALRTGDLQPYRDTGAYVPFVLVLPAAGWQPPSEWSTITDDYPDFERYFVERDPGCARWYELEAR